MRGGPSPHGDAERIDVSARARIVFPASASGCAFDVFLDEPNHEDPGFCRRCGVALSSLSPAGSNWYGLYCPFPDEEPVLNHLASTGREQRLRNGNLVFPIHDLPQDMVDFSSASLLYFGLSFSSCAPRTHCATCHARPRSASAPTHGRGLPGWTTSTSAPCSPAITPVASCTRVRRWTGRLSSRRSVARFWTNDRERSRP